MNMSPPSQHIGVRQAADTCSKAAEPSVSYDRLSSGRMRKTRPDRMAIGVSLEITGACPHFATI